MGIGSEAQTAGFEIFSEEEWRGLQLFMGENNNDGFLEEGEGAFCVGCHVADWTPAAGPPVVVPDWAPAGMVPPLFTDFTFDNLGTPANPDNPFYTLPPAFNPDRTDFVDYGLGGFLQSSGQTYDQYWPEMGKFKVMTLRNIDLTAPYMHNGVFTTLEEVVDFYNTRDDGTWSPPEVAVNVNHDELGALGLDADDVDDLVAFMKTLSDR